MIEQQDPVLFSADYVRRCQAESIKKKEEEDHFIDIYGIDKWKFDTMMEHVRKTVMSFANAANKENKAIVHVTEAWRMTAYWKNETFRKNLSYTIEKNYSKISMAFHSKLEELGFKVEAKQIDWALPEDMVMTKELFRFKEIELIITW